MRRFALLCVFLAACGPGGDPQDSSLSRGPKYGSKTSAVSPPNVPSSPAPKLTPGALCNDPDEYRYPEHIPYCRRDVSRDTKDKVFSLYESAFQFSVQSIGREHFKIDHYIPLCMGGGNEVGNLWPQHESVYPLTDPIEFRLCQMMEQGALSQADAILLIREVKAHLERAQSFLRDLESGTVPKL